MESLAQKKAKANFKKAIAYRKKTGCSLKEAFAHVKGKNVGSVKKRSSSPLKKKVAKKKVVSKKAASLHTDTKSHNVNIRVMSGIGVNTLSHHVSSWFALIPQKGSVPKKDRIKTSMLLTGTKLFNIGNSKSIFQHAADENAAKFKMLKLQNKLSKKYYGYIFKDVQFGKMDKNKPDIVLYPDGTGVHLTQLQKQNIYLI